MQVFTVIGLWADTEQRFATHVHAKDAVDAEIICTQLNEGLTVCGVIRGRHECVDREPSVSYSSPEGL